LRLWLDSEVREPLARLGRVSCRLWGQRVFVRVGVEVGVGVGIGIRLQSLGNGSAPQ
jgi:hypothetical protein